MLLFGITGKAGAGKDTLADILANCINSDPELYELHGYVTINHFANHLKWFSNKLFYGEVDKHKFGRPNFFDDKEEKIPNLNITHREFLQKFGFFMKETCGSNYWADKLFRDLVNFPNTAIIIPDVRYNNEAKIIKAKGGQIIEVLRPNNPLKVPNHESEMGIDKTLIDMTVNNTSNSPEEFRDDIISVLPFVLGLAEKDMSGFQEE